MTTARGPRRADGWTAEVRERLGLGRLLPLGDPADGVWIAETAAASVLRGAAARPGAVLGELRIGLAVEAAPGEDAVAVGTVTGARAGGRGGPGGPQAPADRGGAVGRKGAKAPPAPPSALPTGPLRIEAEFSAVPDRPLPDTAAALRAALLTAAAARLGLEITEVDLTVTALLEGGASDQVTASPAAPTARVAEPQDPVATAAAGTPGVVSLTRVLGSPVHTARDHVRVEVATAGDRRALDVARSVRTAVAAVTEERLPVSVLVTDVVGPGGAPAGEPGRTDA
ncbi:hypothetical protein [Streptomyces sp. Cmuel-A718b]|uniref:hypothetical protein n=1 Tax=Streptomyces sp. Cmuel-A718b TaxID=697328 RepID=UPI00081E339F|nr:hypothetical protein [Streptomyces sp. Cmuel-A718b]SCF85019.1 hypothetical protein GA0115280_116252 [Streptomyces sp. Cmuel-A718b]